MLKQVHPEIGISKKAMLIMESFVNDIFERLGEFAASPPLIRSLLSTFGVELTCHVLRPLDAASEAGKLATYNKKATISSREIQTGE